MFKKNKAQDAPRQPLSSFDAAMDWEASRIATVEKSERRAWMVAFASTGVTVLSLGAIAMMMPLKETVPYVVRVDNTTGVPDIITAMKDRVVTGDEVMDKYWLAQYVRARETYDWYTIQRDYNTVGLLSSPHVGASYAQLFEGKDALDKQYGKSVRSTVDIISVVPASKGAPGTVRFSKTTKRVDQEGPGTTSKWVATVAYEYRSTAHIKESARLVNPFGFQVLTYRVDPEMVGSAQETVIIFVCEAYHVFDDMEAICHARPRVWRRNNLPCQKFPSSFLMNLLLGR